MSYFNSGWVKETTGCSRVWRRLGSSVGFGLLVGVVWLAAQPNALVRGAADDEAQVREQIENYWRSFDNVQLETTEAYDCDDDRFDERKEIRLAWNSDGRSAHFVKRSFAGSTIRLDTRQDRTKAYRVTYFDASTPAMNQISIQSPWNGPGEYRGERFLSLWILLPGGKTPARHLADGATLRQSGPLAAHRWSLAGDVQKTRFDCVLDEQHDYLPVAMTFASERFEGRIEVDHFDRQGGFWFPARGHGTLTTKPLEGTFRSTHEFAVNQVRFNEPIPASRFGMPTPTAGVEIVDSFTSSMHIEGGKFARETLKQRFPPPRRRKPDAPIVQVPPSIAPAGSWLSSAMIAIGSLMGLIVALLMLRRR